MSATAVSDTQINLSWTAGDAAKAHRIYISTDNVTFTEKGTVAAGTSTYSATGLTNYTQYYFKVVAYSDIKESTPATANTYTLYAFSLESTGTGAGVSTLRFESSANITLTATGNVKFYDNTGGTINEGTTRTVTGGELRTFYLKCASSTGKIIVNDITKLTKWGGSSSDGWVSSTNASKITSEVNKLTITELRLTGKAQLTGSLPAGLTYLRLNDININWTYTGALPTGLTFLWLYGSNINWTYTGALPNGLTCLLLNGSNINWTGLDVGNSGNIGAFNLTKYRISKMNSTDMVTLLTQLKGRAGSLPATITINDYADYASPPVAVTNAVAALKAAKPNVTTVNLGS